MGIALIILAIGVILFLVLARVAIALHRDVDERLVEIDRVEFGDTTSGVEHVADSDHQP